MSRRRSRPGRSTRPIRTRKNLKAFRGYVQGYNAQAAVTEQQIVIAAEVNTDPQDFGHLGPMMSAVQRELERVGVSERIGAVVADAGYWHFQQMDELAAQGIPVLIPPDSKKRKTTRPGWDGGRYAWMRRLLASDHGREIYAKRHKLVEPVFGQIKFNRKHRPLPTTRPCRGALGMAISSDDTQPPQAPRAPDRHRRPLNGPCGADIADHRQLRSTPPRARSPPPRSIYPTATDQSTRVGCGHLGSSVAWSRVCEPGA